VAADAAPTARTGPPRLAAVLGPPLCLLALLMCAVGVDAFRIGFMADDFHFLDVARRLPLWRTLAGQHGIWPWVRPLSRELYFSAAAAAGPGALVLAHTLSLAALFGCAWLLWRLGRRLVGADAAAIGVALFLAYDFTKFLAAWASGFQDLLALLLVLAALDAWLAGRRGPALLWAGLAPFAKEPAFLVFPLLVASALVDARRAPGRAWLARLLAVAGAAAALHVGARLTWHTAGGTGETTHGVARLGVIAGQAIAGFFHPRVVPGVAAPALAVLAGLAAAGWMALAARRGVEAPAAPPGSEVGRTRGVRFVAVAMLLGALPAGAGHLLRLTFGHAYHLYPAVPWLALLAGHAITRLPRALWRVAVPVLLAINVWGMGYRAPDLADESAWQFTNWSWPEVVRIDAVTRRLAGDVREQLATRPDSAVVLYEALPRNSFFQTEDGPATREALRDTRVRAYWVNDPPPGVRGDDLVILAFEPSTRHLARAHWSDATAILRSTNAAIAGRGAAAEAFTRYEEAGRGARFDRLYIRAAAALLQRGPNAYVRSLAEAGLTDSLRPVAAAIETPLVRARPGLGTASQAMQRAPLTASSHAAFAESLLAAGIVPHAALELRIAVTLEPHRWRDRFRLAALMMQMGGATEALEELRRIAADPAAGRFAEEAQRAIEEVTRAGAPIPGAPEDG
jgi:hypothetical protein